MANADGGELVVGIENNGDVTGVPHPEEKCRLFLGVPKDRNYVTPSLPCRTREVKTADGLRLLHFEVDWSPSVHLLSDSRCLPRVGSSNQPFDKDKIKALKDTKHQGLFERTFPAGSRIEDLDDALLAHFAEKAGTGLPAREVLSRLHLTEGRNGHAVPTLAALLLFGRDPLQWHDRCGIDFVRWEGSERKSGPELNITKRLRIDAPLAILPSRTFEEIKPFIRERQQLHDLFFIEKLEYPTFAWQEAIVNAVAHRDYAIHGMGIEVWMFDDRLEIRSPGLPPSPVTLDALARRQHIHCSRNPLIVRALTTLGYMRELGEGVPRMFDEMEKAGCYPPRFDTIGGIVVQVTLRNEPIYDRTTWDWLNRFKDIELTGDQKRMLAYAHAHGDRFTSRNYQDVVETDIYGASTAIKDMVRKGIVRSSGKRSRIYLVQEPFEVVTDMPPGFVDLLPMLQRNGRIRNEDVRRALAMNRIAATRFLKEKSLSGWLAKSGKRGLGAFYAPGPRLLHQAKTSNNGPKSDAMGAETDAMEP
jgi:ATP-dependent DNA helicase RecG